VHAVVHAFIGYNRVSSMCKLVGTLNFVINLIFFVRALLKMKIASGALSLTSQARLSLMPFAESYHHIWYQERQVMM
jgi:hypothetical protein